MVSKEIPRMKILFDQPKNKSIVDYAENADLISTDILYHHSMTETATELIHLTYEGNFTLECSAKVLECRVVSSEADVSTTKDNNDKEENDVPLADSSSSTPEKEVKVELILDATTMHPQGGGQPTDVGTISSRNPTAFPAAIDKVTIDRATNVVTHAGRVTLFGSSSEVPFDVGSIVDVSVNSEQRKILSECHTAGHVVDAAMAKCGCHFPPTKGYHFLDGSYVEYRGSVPPNERPELLSRLKIAFSELIEEDIPTSIQTLSREKAEEECNRLQQNFDLQEFSPNGEDIRVVTVANWSCPCGGTHVKSTGALKENKWGITGLKSKKDVIRVKYGRNSGSE